MPDLRSSLLLASVLDRRGLRQLARWSRRRLLGPRAPSSLQIGLTDRCQARCAHCSAAVTTPDRREHSLAELEAILAQARAMAIPRIHLVGGEPTLRHDLPAILDHATGLGLITVLETNGYAMDPAVLQRRPNQIVSISLDHHRAEDHDAHRGLPGSHARALAMMDACEGARLPYLLSTCVSHDDRAKLEGLRGLLRGRRWSLGLRVLILRPAGRLLGRDDLALGPRERARYRRMGPGPRVWFGGYFGEPSCSLQRGAYFHIDAAGEVLGCQYLPIRFGNLREEPLEVILARLWASPLWDHPEPYCLLEDADLMARVAAVPGQRPVWHGDVPPRPTAQERPSQSTGRP